MAPLQSPRDGFTLEAKEPFGCVIDGVRYDIAAGELVASDHPAAVAHPRKFERSQRQRPDVEQATAAPGEKRGRRGRRS